MRVDIMMRSNTSNLQEIKRENVLNADEEQKISKEDLLNNLREIDSLEDADEEYPLVTSTTEDKETDSSSSSKVDEDVSDDEENPVMAEYLDKITREMSTSNPALMHNLRQIWKDMKKSHKVSGGQKRSAISEHSEQSRAKRRSV